MYSSDMKSQRLFRSPTRNTPRQLLAGCALLLATAAVQATAVTLDMTKLPSEQGWTYFNNAGVAESTIFSLAPGNILVQNSIGIDQRAAWYEIPGIIDPTLPIRIDFRARVTSDEIFVPSPAFGGFGVFTQVPGDFFEITLKTHEIADAFPNILDQSVDNTVFHDYRLDITPRIGYQFYVDGALVASGLPRNEPVSNALILGDGTGDANAHAEIASFTFFQSPVSNIPEPSSISLILAAGLGLGIVRVKVRRETA